MKRTPPPLGRTSPRPIIPGSCANSRTPCAPRRRSRRRGGIEPWRAWRAASPSATMPRSRRRRRRAPRANRPLPTLRASRRGARRRRYLPRVGRRKQGLPRRDEPHRGGICAAHAPAPWRAHFISALALASPTAGGRFRGPRRRRPRLPPARHRRVRYDPISGPMAMRAPRRNDGRGEARHSCGRVARPAHRARAFQNRRAWL